jgi:hypothetical protein
MIQVEEGSGRFTSIEMIIQSVRYVRSGVIDFEELIQTLQNTMAEGYKLTRLSDSAVESLDQIREGLVEIKSDLQKVIDKV